MCVVVIVRFEFMRQPKETFCNNVVQEWDSICFYTQLEDNLSSKWVRFSHTRLSKEKSGTAKKFLLVRFPFGSKIIEFRLISQAEHIRPYILQLLLKRR